MPTGFGRPYNLLDNLLQNGNIETGIEKYHQYHRWRRNNFFAIRFFSNTITFYFFNGQRFILIWWLKQENDAVAPEAICFRSKHATTQNEIITETTRCNISYVQSELDKCVSELMYSDISGDITIIDFIGTALHLKCKHMGVSGVGELVCSFVGLWVCGCGFMGRWVGVDL